MEAENARMYESEQSTRDAREQKREAEIGLTWEM